MPPQESPSASMLIRLDGQPARDHDYVTIAQAAEHFGFPKWQIQRAVSSGRLKSYRFYNTRQLVRLSDIRALLEASAKGGHRG